MSSKVKSQIKSQKPKSSRAIHSVVSSPLYEEMYNTLDKNGCILELEEIFENHNIFQEYHVGEEFEGVQYRIPLKEWNRIVSMDIKCSCFDNNENCCKQEGSMNGNYCQGCLPLYNLNQLLDSYQGWIELEIHDGEICVCSHGVL